MMPDASHNAANSIHNVIRQSDKTVNTVAATPDDLTQKVSAKKSPTNSLRTAMKVAALFS